MAAPNMHLEVKTTYFLRLSLLPETTIAVVQLQEEAREENSITHSPSASSFLIKMMSATWPTITPIPTLQ